MVWMGEHEVAIYSPRHDTLPLPRKVVERLEGVNDMVSVLRYEDDDTSREVYYNFTGVLLNLV